MEYYLYLLQVLGVANPKALKVAGRFGSAENAYLAVKEGNTSFLKPYEIKRLQNSSVDESLRIMEFCNKNVYRIVSYFDHDYPQNLKNIFNPPLVIFVLGNLKPLNEKICINVIGKRKASSYALHAATAICEPLAKIGTVIISGFALGIDVAAMSAALNAGGITAGVLACGIDVDYPRGSMSFRSDVANSGGAVITECLPGTRAGRQAFQIRNRLMSGLAQGTLVIEAGEQSGCHITAEHTLNQNRDLFCVPPCDIFDPEVTGTVRYLRDGAVPVFDYTDIVNAYQMYYGQMLVEYAADDNRKKEDPTAVAGTYPEKSDPTTRFPGNIDSVEIITPKNPVRPEVEPEKIPAKRISEVMAVLSEDCKKIYDFLQIERTAAIDDITAKTELPADAVNAALLDLEIEGLVEPLGGTRYKIID